MPYVKVTEGGVVYPFKPDDLRRGPRHSFPAGDIPESTLAEHGVFPVVSTTPLAASPGFVVEEAQPVEANGVWAQQWSSRPMNAGEVHDFRERRKNDVLKLLGRKIDAVALGTALDENDLLIINNMSKLAAATMAYMLASSSAPYRNGVASCRTNARSLVSQLNNASGYAAIAAVDITAGWPV